MVLCPMVGGFQTFVGSMRYKLQLTDADAPSELVSYPSASTMFQVELIKHGVNVYAIASYHIIWAIAENYM